MDSYRNRNPSNRRCRGRYRGPGNRRMTRTDKVFDKCVDILIWTAEKTGTTYKQVNVAVFCVIWPAVTVGLVVAYVLKK